jgi:hypothetical protein
MDGNQLNIGRVAMKRNLLLVLIVSLSLVVPLTAAVTNQGAEKIELSGGDRGKVLFPHHQHQTALGDCNICHQLFPQTPGAIDAMKAKGQLEQKQVMNKMCIKCHKAEKMGGRPSGPTACTQCHIK